MDGLHQMNSSINAASNRPTNVEQRRIAVALAVRPWHRSPAFDSLWTKSAFDTSAGTGQAPSAGSGQAPSAGSGQAPSAGSGQAPSAGSGQAPSAGSGQALRQAQGSKP